MVSEGLDLLHQRSGQRYPSDRTIVWTTCVIWAFCKYTVLTTLQADFSLVFSRLQRSFSSVVRYGSTVLEKLSCWPYFFTQGLGQNLQLPILRISVNSHLSSFSSTLPFAKARNVKEMLDVEFAALRHVWCVRNGNFIFNEDLNECPFWIDNPVVKRQFLAAQYHLLKWAVLDTKNNQS